MPKPKKPINRLSRFFQDPKNIEELARQTKRGRKRFAIDSGKKEKMPPQGKKYVPAADRKEIERRLLKSLAFLLGEDKLIGEIDGMNLYDVAERLPKFIDRTPTGKLIKLLEEMTEKEAQGNKVVKKFLTTYLLAYKEVYPHAPTAEFHELLYPLTKVIKEFKKAKRIYASEDGNTQYVFITNTNELREMQNKLLQGKTINVPYSVDEKIKRGDKLIVRCKYFDLPIEEKGDMPKKGVLLDYYHESGAHITRERA